MCSQGGIIREQHLPNENTPHLCLGTKTCKVEEISIGSGKEVYAIFRLVEGKRQQHREENAEECWGKHTSLFHSTLYWEWIWGGAIILNGSSHTFVEGCNYLQKLGGQPILWRRVKSPFLLTKSKAFVRSKKAMYNARFCSRHFSCNCLSEKIMSQPRCRPVTVCALHWVLGARTKDRRADWHPAPDNNYEKKEKNHPPCISQVGMSGHCVLASLTRRAGTLWGLEGQNLEGGTFCLRSSARGAKRPSGGRVWEGGIPPPTVGTFSKIGV